MIFKFDENDAVYGEIGARHLYHQGIIAAEMGRKLAHIYGPIGQKYYEMGYHSVGVKDPEQSGVKKYDAGKAPLMQGCINRFPLALEQIARISAYGKEKYGTFDGWEDLPDAFNRYDDGFGRHTVLRKSEGEYDIKDSGLPHLGQRAWNALATLELALRDGLIEMTDGNRIEDGKPVLGSNGRSNAPLTEDQPSDKLGK